jgi:hypothetical protein
VEVGVQFLRPRQAWLPILVLSLLATACGGDKDSPTAPSQAAGGLSITELTVQSWGAPGDVTYRLAMWLNETSGRVPITLTSLSIGFDNSGTATAPIENIRINSGATERIPSLTFTDKSGRPSGARLTITIGYRGDNSRTGSATASANIQNFALVTLSGQVTDRTTGLPIAAASLRVQSIGPNENKTARTDANGIYALGPLTVGAFRVFYEATGYTGQSHPIDISTDATWNVALERDQPAFDVEYTLTGTARRCDVTYRGSGGSLLQSTVSLPWSYRRTARTGDFLYLSCHISSVGETGSVAVSIYKRGSLFASAFATGYPNIATASGSF